jgi:hypothetical protein
MASNNIAKKRKFVADGIFYAELNEFLQRELGTLLTFKSTIAATPTNPTIPYIPRSLTCPYGHMVEWM